MNVATEHNEDVVLLALQMKFREIEPLNSMRDLHGAMGNCPNEERLSRLWAKRVSPAPGDIVAQKLMVFVEWLNGLTRRNAEMALPHVRLLWDFPGALAVDTLMDRVCEYAGHAWLTHEDDVADFLPDAMKLDVYRKATVPIEELICSVVFRLLDNGEGVPGVVRVRKRKEESELWKADRDDPDIDWSISVSASQGWAIPDELTDSDLIYAFEPSPPERHNCVTWAAMVLLVKRNDWFDSLRDQYGDGLKDHVFKTGRMRQIWRIVLDGT